MKTNFLNQLACGAFAVMIAASFNLSAKAQGYINGTISFDGGALLNAPLGSASQFISIFGPGSDPLPEVLGGSQTGTYATVFAGTPAIFPAFTFIPSPVSSFPLWSFNFGGNTYSFQADSITFVYQNGIANGFLDIAGTGTASISGGAYYDTPGTWSIVDTGQGSSVITFGAATQVTGPPVPEPSAFALLASFVPVIGAFAYRAKAKA
jgi:hypothetical protein